MEHDKQSKLNKIIISFYLKNVKRSNSLGYEKVDWKATEVLLPAIVGLTHILRFDRLFLLNIFCRLRGRRRIEIKIASVKLKYRAAYLSQVNQFRIWINLLVEVCSHAWCYANFFSCMWRWTFVSFPRKFVSLYENFSYMWIKF